MGNVAKPNADSAADTRFVRSIKAVCPQCHRKYRLDERYAGRQLQCRTCGERVDVPGHVEVVARPVEQGPGLVARLLTRLVTFLTGRSGETRISRSKWLSTRQARLTMKLVCVAAAIGVGVGIFFYLGTDAAKLRFGRSEGKEIAFRKIVELEEDLVTVLTGVRSKEDAEQATARIEAILDEQNDLWETLVEWQDDGFLTAGEANLLRTRYRDRYAKATGTITAERLRIGKIAGANQQVLKALGDRSGDAAVAKRRVIGGTKF